MLSKSHKHDRQVVQIKTTFDAVHRILSWSQEAVISNIFLSPLLCLLSLLLSVSVIPLSASRLLWCCCHFQLLSLSAVITSTRPPLPIIPLHPLTTIHELQLHVFVYYSWELHQRCSRLWRHLRGSCFYSYVLLAPTLRAWQGAE